MTNEEVPRDAQFALPDAILHAVEAHYEHLGTGVPRWQLVAQLEAIDQGLATEERYSSLSRRIGERRFLALGTLGVTSLSILAGLLVNPLALGAAAWKLRRLLYWDREWRPKVIALYADLDGVQGDVFEAVHDLESNAVVVNFDALYERRFDDAYGTVAPTSGDIHQLLSEYERHVIDETLALLAKSQILKTDGERYWISF